MSTPVQCSANDHSPAPRWDSPTAQMSFEADPSIDKSEDPGGATPKPVIGPISTNVGELLGRSAM